MHLLRGEPPDETDLQLLGYLAATPSLTALRSDSWPAWFPVWAARAAAAVGGAEHAEGLRGLLADADPRCRAVAAQALERLSARLDRDLTDPG